MRLYAPTTDSTLDQVYVLLTLDEARELRAGLGQLLRSPNRTHRHVSGDEGVELEVELYGPGVDIEMTPRKKRVIESNE